IASFLGCLGEIALIWTLADTTMGMMALVNLVALVPLTAVACRLLGDYNEQRRQGIEPVFTRDRLPDLQGVECWGPEAPRAESATAERGSSCACPNWAFTRRTRPGTRSCARLDLSGHLRHEHEKPSTTVIFGPSCSFGHGE